MSEGAREPDVRGDLTRYPFPRLLYFLCKKDFTGELVVYPPGGKPSRTYFREGLAVYTDLAAPEDVLGRVLLERGAIGHEAFNASLQELSRGGGLLQGQILLGLGALSEADLVEGLRTQLRRKLLRFFRMDSAGFELYSGDHPYGSDGEGARVRADPLWVIYQGVRNAYSAGRLGVELEKLDGHVVRLRPEFARMQGRYGLGQDETGMLQLLERAPMPIERVFAVSNLGPVHTQMLVYTLWVTEMLLAKPKAEADAEAATARTLTAAAAVAVPRASEAPPAATARASVAPEAAKIPEARRSGSLPWLEGVKDDGLLDSGPGVEGGPDGDVPVVDLPPLFMPDPNPATGPSGTVLQHAVRPPAARPATTPSAASPTEASAASSTTTGTRPAVSKATPEQAAELRKLILDAFAKTEGKNHFEVLAVARNASTEAVRDAYFKLAKQFHPDRVNGLGLQDVIKQAEELFRRINEAHTVLTNLEAKKAYEAQLDGKGNEADEAARAALQAELEFQKGLVFHRKKAFVEAVAAFKEAVRLNPKEAEHLAWMAWSLFQDPRTDHKQMLPKIKQQLLEAVQMKPNNQACQYFLGEVYLSTGDEGRAMTCFNKVLDINPDHIDAQRQVRLIRMRRDRGGKGAADKGGLFGLKLTLGSKEKAASSPALGDDDDEGSPRRPRGGKEGKSEKSGLFDRFRKK
ncbi:MAG: DnaJ domain-containing protein [Deltaproteobacteria bacterium]|nr:DnaJ domain-containing protein [Deltaproteobacteria bacterium]